MTAALTDLIADLDAYLDSPAFADYGPNGLQVPGPDEVAHVVTGVSASAALFERAAALAGKQPAALATIKQRLHAGAIAALEAPQER